MQNIIDSFSRIISYALICLAMIYVAYLTLEIFWLFGDRLLYALRNRTFQTDMEGRPVAGLFFSVLLILEIVETIRVFSKDHSVKIRIILIVGMIAVTRKILMLEISHSDALMEIAIACLIIALSVGYFLVGRSKVEE